MTKRILSLFIALIGIATVAQADTYYKIKVAGVEVNSSNASSITHADRIKAYKSDVNGGKPSITYSGDATSGTLTLYNVKIERTGKDNRAILNDGNPGLTIILKGENYLKAEDSSPVRLNANTVVKSEMVNGSDITEIVGGSEDALTVGSGATVTLRNAHLVLRSNSSVFDASDNPTLIVEDSEIFGYNEKTKNGDSYGLRDYKQLTVRNSRFYLCRYAQADVVSNLQGFTLGKGMKLYGWGAADGVSYDSSKKTFVDKNGNTIKIILDMQMGIPIDETNFPDANFRSYVLSEIDTNKDGYLHAEEIENTTTINVSKKKIESLKGIEYFTELKVLDCSTNWLPDLDVSKNTKLVELTCYNCSLIKLNLWYNTALQTLDISGNSLKELNVSRNTQLTSLICYFNHLTTLDLSNNKKLTLIDCKKNEINGRGMFEFVDYLPQTNNGKLIVVDENEDGNSMTKNQVYTAKQKGWNVYKTNGYELSTYVGEVISGDVNGDNEVNVGDIMAVINYMAGKTTGIDKKDADVNGDGKVNVGDIMAIINIMAGD